MKDEMKHVFYCWVEKNNITKQHILVSV